MSNTTANVTTGKPKVSGSIYRAPLGSTLPTDAASDLGAAFACMGYISDNGVTNNNSPESDSVKAWGGDTVLHFQTDKPDTFGFTMLEVQNEEVLKSVYGDDNVTVTAATASDPKQIAIQANSKELEESCWVIDMIMTNHGMKRIVIPKGKITEIGEVHYQDSDAVGYDVTVSAVPDASGNTHYEYMSVGVHA
ncbi:MAG: phage tail protein [Clostridia bacterium]|nr:phage tail protein [Clostridia bacterium]